MNQDQLHGLWKQLEGKVRVQWSRLTDDDIGVIAGKTEQLIGKIQERYGIGKEEAERQYQAFIKKTQTSPPTKPRPA